MARQMTVEDRKRMDFLLQLGWTPAQTAEDRGRSKSTILHETINRSVPCDRGYRRSNRICARFDACPRIRGYGKDAKRSFNCTPRCFEVCPDFVEQGCGRLDVPSRVCNGCRDFKSCQMMKRLYVADGAQANRESLLHDSRSGVHPDAEALARMNAVLSPCIMRGQSVRNVAANNPETLGSVKERTVYDYIAGGLFDAKRGDLPEACSRKPGKKRKETGTNAKCRAGRDYRTFLEFCRVNEVKEWTELDTVVGRVGGRVLFTMILPGGPMLMFLRDRKSSQTCTRVFNMLWELAGPELSRRLFSVILTDNGTEFSDPDMIEKWRPDPEHNQAARRARAPRGETRPAARRLVRRAHAGRRQPRRKPRRKLLARRPRQPDALRRVRGEVRRAREEAPGRARHRQDPRERGHARPDPPRREVQAPRGQGHPQEGRRNPSEETRRAEVKQPPVEGGVNSPLPIPAENTLRTRAAGALYHIPAPLCRKVPIRPRSQGQTHLNPHEEGLQASLP